MSTSKIRAVRCVEVYFIEPDSREFEYVGNGYCLDSRNNRVGGDNQRWTYDIRIREDASAATCENACLADDECAG